MVVVMLLLTVKPVMAEMEPSQTVELSILTCQPGDPLYSKYGHTAIHLLDTTYNIDYVFNYGVFDFRSKNFLIRFISGDTDYMLDIEPTRFFYESSHMVGRYNIYEQRLNLSYEQRCAIIHALLENARPENCYYRYNFVFDNCATQPYRIIRKTLGVELSTPEFDRRKDSFREKIRYYSGKYTWGGYSINLLFGRDADRVMEPEERLFLPEELMDYLSEATLPDGSHLSEGVCGPRPFEPENGHWFGSPQMVELIILLIALIIGVIDRRRGKQSWWFDVCLLVLLGILGVVITYLSFFSSHPLVGHNFNLIWLNPLMPTALIVAICTQKGRKWLSGSRKGVLSVGLYYAIGMLVIALSGQKETFLVIPTALLVHIALSWWQKTAYTPEHISKNTSGARFVAVATLLSVAAFVNAQDTRLTVVAVVDGMSSDAMRKMRDYWGAGGLRTLSEEAYQTEIEFLQLAYGGAELTTTLMTGCYPDEHGIVSNKVMQRSDRTVHNIFEDKTQAGIGTDDRLSAKSIKTMTISDEFRLRNGEESHIYAVGLDAANTIAMGGHSADACCWIDAKQKRWVTTSYYPEGLPESADKANISQEIAKAADAVWTAEMDINMYLRATAQEKKQKGFSYNLEKELLCSPAANRLVTSLALDIQKDKQMGKSKYSDMLLLGYTVVSPSVKSDYLESAEQEEMYVSLNQELGYLKDQLERRIGTQNLKIVVVGKPHWGRSEEQLKSANIGVEHFDVNRAAALLNTYLMAIYGHERWIDGGYGQSIYLNRTIIEQKKMSLSELQNQVAQFLMEFDGVKEAYPVWQVPLLGESSSKALLKHWCNMQLTGDVVFTLDDNCLLFQSDEQIDFLSDKFPSAPLYIWTGNRSPHPTYHPSAVNLKELVLGR